VCVELRENPVLHVENKIILRLSAVVVKVPGTIFQNTKGTTSSHQLLYTEKQSNSSNEDSYVFVVNPPVENEVSPKSPKHLKPFQLLLKGLILK
jgi:hypothetical protein